MAQLLLTAPPSSAHRAYLEGRGGPWCLVRDREQVGGTIGDRALKKETQCKRSSQEAMLLIPPGMGTFFVYKWARSSLSNP